MLKSLLRSVCLAVAVTAGIAVGTGAALAQEAPQVVVATVEEGPGGDVAAEVAPEDQPEDLVESPDTAPSGGLDYNLVQLIQFGGIVGYVIIALSVIAVGLIIDDLLLLRHKVLLPADEIEELRALVAAGRGAEVAAGQPRSSFIGAMAVAGLRELDRGYEAVVKGMEDAADEVTGRLLRRIEYLNVIANVSPMLGLLGTVMGMVQCFNQISVAAGGADPRLLAAGIFQALMTTVMGLIVAIPAFFAFSLFRNRVDALAAAAAARAEEVLSPLRPGAGAVRS
jgi:biopolymer transport protein ExbB